jgi:hypothetical protein
MSEIIEEDVVGGCTRALVAVLESYRPPNLANLSPVYSNSSDVKEKLNGSES